MPYETYRPTDVSVVLDYLTALDDFANKKMIIEATGIPDNRIRPALAHLAKHFAIDCAIVNENELWWFATPASDDRKIKRQVTPNGITRTEKGRRSRPRSKNTPGQA